MTHILSGRHAANGAYSARTRLSLASRRGAVLRLRRLGVTCLASVHALADGASWIWKAVQRVLTGCVQTLDIFHGCGHVHKCAERIHGEDSAETKAAFKRGRALLVSQGWAGICQWVGELLSVEDEKERERRRKATDRLIGYFVKHVGRLNYAERLKVNGGALKHHLTPVMRKEMRSGNPNKHLSVCVCVCM